MGENVTRSIWFPVGRANFYSAAANGWLISESGTSAGAHLAVSRLLDAPNYTPRLQVSVLRRLLEVLPRSFGYEREGSCTFSEDEPETPDESATSGSTRQTRPVSVTLTLRPLRDPMPPGDCPQRRANAGLVEHGVPWVTLTVDENGFYTLSAPSGTNADDVRKAIDVHLAEVFGGAFRTQWQLDEIDPRTLRDHERAAGNGSNSSSAAANVSYDAPAMLYNGLPDPKAKGQFKPLGIFTFFQLNTLFEGLFNDALTPAVFFDQGARIVTYLLDEDEDGEPDTPTGPRVAVGSPGTARGESRVSHLAGVEALEGERSGNSVSAPSPHTASSTRPPKILWYVSDIIEQLKTEADATEHRGQVVTLRHFLAITSRESLQKFKWSVESVRRGLLDEMMGILHRQSTLVQLRLDKAGAREWVPELAQGANESQLRGYVMLAGAKLPLISNVHRYAEATRDTLLAGRLPTSSPERDLVYRVSEWGGLIKALDESIRGLERSVEHAWMERLLYEQEQSRAEQEAMAEIERTQNLRPAGSSGEANPALGGTYNAVMLYFTIFAAVTAVWTLSTSKISLNVPLPVLLRSLWPLFALAAALALLPILDRILRRAKAVLLGQEATGYEFAFRLDRLVEPKQLKEQLSIGPAVLKSLRKGDRAEAARLRCKKLRGLQLERRGGARGEFVSTDSTLVKLHLAARFRTRRGRRWWNPYGWWRRPARFEIINEFLVRKASGDRTFLLRETRVFGESPRALDPDEIVGLLTFVINRAGLVFQSPAQRQQLTAEQVLEHARMIFNPATAVTVAAEREAAATV